MRIYNPGDKLKLTVDVYASIAKNKQELLGNAGTEVIVISYREPVLIVENPKNKRRATITKEECI